MDFRDEEWVDVGFWKKWGVVLLLAGTISAAFGITIGLQEERHRKQVIWINIQALVNQLKDESTNRTTGLHRKTIHAEFMASLTNEASTFHQSRPLKTLPVPKRSSWLSLGIEGLFAAVFGVCVIRAAHKREYQYASRSPERDKRTFLAAFPEFRFATVWRRLGAHLLDAIALGLTHFACGLLVDSSSRLIGVFGLFLRMALPYSYVVILTGIRGQTIGKWLCRVKVLDVANTPLTMKQSLLRSCVPFVLSLAGIGLLASSKYAVFEHASPWKMGLFVVTNLFFLIWWCADGLTMLVTQKRRAIHDYIAHSVVVHCAD